MACPMRSVRVCTKTRRAGRRAHTKARRHEGPGDGLTRRHEDTKGWETGRETGSREGTKARRHEGPGDGPGDGLTRRHEDTKGWETGRETGSHEGTKTRRAGRRAHTKARRHEGLGDGPGDGLTRRREGLRTIHGMCTALWFVIHAKTRRCKRLRAIHNTFAAFFECCCAKVDQYSHWLVHQAEICEQLFGMHRSECFDGFQLDDKLFIHQ